MKRMQDQGPRCTSHQNQLSLPETVSTPPPWQGSCQLSSTVPPRFVDLRSTGKSIGIARRAH